MGKHGCVRGGCSKICGTRASEPILLPAGATSTTLPSERGCFLVGPFHVTESTKGMSCCMRPRDPCPAWIGTRRALDKRTPTETPSLTLTRTPTTSLQHLASTTPRLAPSDSLGWRLDQGVGCNWNACRNFGGTNPLLTTVYLCTSSSTLPFQDIDPGNDHSATGPPLL